MTRRILITGGAGFVPSSLADKLAEYDGYEIVLVDNLLTGKLSNVPTKSNCSFIKCDVNNREDISAVMLSNRFDYVFHYAAVVGVARTLQNPRMVLQDLMGFENIFELSKNTGVKRVFFSSSSEVYGEPVHLPQHEEVTPLNSRLPYAVVKNVGECFCKTYSLEHNLPYTIFRFFNTYGPKQSSDFVVARFLSAALTNQDITVYGDGLQTRTFLYIDDNTSFTQTILRESLCLNEVINLGSDVLCTVRELAETIIQITGSKSKIVNLPALKEGDMTRRQPDIEKFRAIYQQPLVTLREGLTRIVAEYTLA
jgi:nucleoside-diphosphate-sugar epimerase